MKNPCEELRECIGKLRYAKNRSEEGVVELHDRALAAVEVVAAELELRRWGLQWMLNDLTGIDHEWAKEACNIARQSLNPQPKG